MKYLGSPGWPYLPNLTDPSSIVLCQGGAWARLRAAEAMRWQAGGPCVCTAHQAHSDLESIKVVQESAIGLTNVTSGALAGIDFPLN